MSYLNSLKLILLTIIMVVASCNNEGPPGPVGPAGPQGADGYVGINSYNITVYANDWQEIGLTPPVGYGYQVFISVPDLNQNVLNSGLALVYLVENGVYYLLPATYVFTEENGIYYSSNYWITFEIGTVIITKQDNDGFTSNPGQTSFRIVLVEGMKNLPEGLDPKYYEEVKTFFNLSE